MALEFGTEKLTLSWALEDARHNTLGIDTRFPFRYDYFLEGFSP